MVDCGRICGCGPPPQIIYSIYYKSTSNPDLLQPKTGIYNSSNIKIIEDIDKNGTIVEIPAPKIDGQYVQSGVAPSTRYYLLYISSALQNQKDLRRTLIQLSDKVTDTLTYTFSPGNSFPQETFYNGHSVWKLGDMPEITITK